MKQEEPYLLTSLIRRLTELLHEHGDLPVYRDVPHDGDVQIERVSVEELYEELIEDLPKRVVLS